MIHTGKGVCLNKNKHEEDKCAWCGKITIQKDVLLFIATGLQ
jgi:hypothetical protein